MLCILNCECHDVCCRHSCSSTLLETEKKVCCVLSIKSFFHLLLFNTLSFLFFSENAELLLVLSDVKEKKGKILIIKFSRYTHVV